MGQNDLIFRINMARLSIFGGVILAALVSSIYQGSVLVTQPAVGFVVSFMLLGMSFYFQGNVLLRLLLAYLVGVLVNQAMLKSFELTIGGFNITLFWHLPILTLFFLGFCRVFLKSHEQIAEMRNYYLIAVGGICLHMIILFVMLSQTFGFGYENSTGVFVNLVIFSVFLSGFVAFLTDKVVFRVTSIILCVYFFGIILLN